MNFLPMQILAIDPGPVRSGWCLTAEDGYILYAGKDENAAVRDKIERTTLVILEGISSYGMPVGKSVFETCYETGKFLIWAEHMSHYGPILTLRRDYMKYFCGKRFKRNDSGLYSALKEKYGRLPAFVGNSDKRSACALALYWFETHAR